MRWMTMIAMMTLTACEVFTACTQMGCGGALELDLGSLESGSWTFTFTGDDGSSASCTFVLPIADGEQVDCPDEFTPMTVTQGTDGVLIALSTNMTDAPPWTSLGLTLTPEGGETLGADVTPAWGDPLYPNGEVCDAPIGCWSAAETPSFAPTPMD
jgi:hypothetical protein